MRPMCGTSSFHSKEMQRETRKPPYRNKTFVYTTCLHTHVSQNKIKEKYKRRKKNTEKPK